MSDKKFTGKVFIAVPSPDYMHVGFVNSLVNLLLTSMSKGISFFYGNFNGSRITENRNALVKMAKESGASHILFIDADMQFDSTFLEQLLAHDLDIVCATTSKRVDDPSVCGKAIGAFEVGGDKPKEVSGGLVEAIKIGFPMMLIKMHVFDKLKFPYFLEPLNEEFNLAEGEDLYFCRMVRAAGFKIWCDIDLSAKLGHIGTKVYYIQKTQHKTDVEKADA